MPRLGLSVLLVALAAPPAGVVPPPTDPVPNLAGRWAVRSATYDGEPLAFRPFDALVLTDRTAEYVSAAPAVAPVFEAS